MDKKPRLGVWEYATLTLGFARVACIVAKAALTAGFRGSNGAPTFKRQILHTANGALLETFTARHLHAVMPSTTDSYKSFAKLKGFEPKISDIRDGVSGCWLGDRNARTILVWLHGGCFVLGANQELFDMLQQMVTQASSHGRELAVLVPEYDLAPDANYPRQLEQVAATLSYLNTQMSKPNSQILVGGDSAGGNLALGLLSLLSHEHPSIPSLKSHEQKLKGTILVSPWVTFDQSAPSFLTNRLKDNLTSAGLKKWSNAYMGDAQPDFFNTPLDAPTEWWQDISADAILVLAGQDELFVDDIRGLAGKLKVRNDSKVELSVADKEPHNDPVFRRTQGISLDDCVSQQILYQWVLDHLQ